MFPSLGQAYIHQWISKSWKVSDEAHSIQSRTPVLPHVFVWCGTCSSIYLLYCSTYSSVFWWRSLHPAHIWLRLSSLCVIRWSSSSSSSIWALLVPWFRSAVVCKTLVRSKSLELNKPISSRMDSLKVFTTSSWRFKRRSLIFLSRSELPVCSNGGSLSGRLNTINWVDATFITCPALT